MHRTSIPRPRTANRRLVFLTLLGALLVLALAQAVPAFGAKTPFDGGPIVADTATYVANDHTVYAMRFSAASDGANPLDPSSTYFVKIRFTTDTTTGQPASTDNRGFIWNGTTQRWVQEAAGEWVDFPTVTTDATGAISQSDWIYYKFGDTAKTGAYAVIVSLSSGVAGNTRNGTSWVNVTVFDPTDAVNGGGWVHPGIDDAANAGRTGKVVDFASPGTLIALQRIEKNGCDDDNDGVVDDEQYGPAQDGSFDLGVPAGQKLQAQVGGSKTTDWPDSNGFTLTVPDTDVALGASDMNAPSAPGSLTATATSSGVDLSWDAATDDTGVTGYVIYRAADAETGAGYTAPYVEVATVTGTSYQDEIDLSSGAQYHYIVRAEDAATNLGPRSNAVGGAWATLAMTRSAKTVKWGGGARLVGVLTSPVAIAGDEVVEVQHSTDAKTWSDLGDYDLLSPSMDGYEVKPVQKTFYRLYWSGGDTHFGAVSTVLTVTPRVKLGRPVAPKVVRKRARFTAYGSLVPKHAAGRKYVAIKCYKKIAGHWRLRKTVKAVDRNRGTATRYTARVALTSRGTWKLVASYKATSRYAATTSSARYVRVK